MFSIRKLCILPKHPFAEQKFRYKEKVVNKGNSSCTWFDIALQQTFCWRENITIFQWSNRFIARVKEKSKKARDDWEDYELEDT